MLGEMETYKYLEKLEVDSIKMEMKENLQKVSQENEETTQKKTISQKSYQRDKHRGCPLCQTLGNIFEVDERGPSTDKRTRKLMTMYKAFYPRDGVDRQYMSRKSRRGLATIQVSVDTSIQHLEDYIKKAKEN